MGQAMSGTGDGEEQWAEIVRQYGQSSLQGGRKNEIEQLTIAAIHEHRRRLDVAQAAHDELESFGENVSASLRCHYEEVVQANDDQQMVVQMLLDILGYTPDLTEE